MKYLKYKHCTQVNHGTEQTPVFEEVLEEKVVGWNEANEEVAKREAFNGVYTIEDDGKAAVPTQEERIAELEEALQMLLSGVTE